MLTYKNSVWLVVALLSALIMFAARQPALAADVKVYKSPSCGCCKKWVSHLTQKGFSVEVINRSNLKPVKSQWGIPSALQSCHTAVVGGYVIEGHVPADDIKRLLDEKPNIKGLVVPGMPMGSPGMEGSRQDSYAVFALDQQGQTSVFSQH